MSHVVEGNIALNTSVLGGAWHNQYNPNSGPMSVETALKLSGAEWEVVQKPVFVDGIEIPGMLANVRTTDQVVLGVVSNVYQPVQNYEAFSFVDNIIGSGEAKIHSAGVLFNKYQRPTRIFVTAELKPTTLMGDKIDNYLVFSHSHDGLNAVKVFVSNVRVVCNNTLTLAEELVKTEQTGADGKKIPRRYWSTKHTGDITAKLKEAQKTLALYEEYMAVVPQIAEGMNAINLYEEEVAKILDALFPDDGTAGRSRMSQNAATMRDEILKCYSTKEDIARFRGTGWGLYQAVTDVVEHISPFRNTATASINREFQVIEGHPVINRAQKIICAMKA